MKKPSDDLFRIIKTLSPSEKRYFKVITSQRESGKASAYHALFDAIDAQDEYDEAALQAKNRDGRFTKNLAMAKIYLQESILKALCTYHAGSADEINIEEKIKESVLLTNRGLRDIAAKLLKQAGRLADKNENTIATLRLARQWLGDQHFRGDDSIEDELKELYERQTTCLEILRQETEISWLHALTHARLNNASLARTEADRARIQEILDHEIARRDPESLPTDTLRYMLHNIHSRCHMVLGDYQKSYKSARRCVEIWETTDIGGGSMSYARLLHNFAVRCLRAAQVEDLQTTLEKLKAIPGNDMTMRKFRFESILTLELNLLSLQRRFDEAIDMIPTIREQLEELGPHIVTNQRMTVVYNLVVACLVCAKFDLALEFVNEILNDEPFNPDLYNIVKLLGLVAHVELRHFDILPNVVRSTRRFLKKRERIFAVEDVLLKRLAKAGDATCMDDEREFYLRLSTELREAAAGSPSARIFEYFDFALWAQCKAEGIRMADHLRREVV